MNGTLVFLSVSASYLFRQHALSKGTLALFNMLYANRRLAFNNAPNTTELKASATLIVTLG